MRQLLMTILIVATAAFAGTAAEWVGLCVEVHDGDTVSVSRGDDAVTVHLMDVDAPELDQPFGEEARQLLTELLLGAEVRVTGVRKDVRGQLSAQVLVGGVDAGRRLIDAGLAWTGDTTDEVVILASMYARSERRGLWQEDDPTPPEIWRRRQEAMKPTPIPVVRSLREAALIVELKKNRNGRAVISGFPSTADKEAADLVAAAGLLQSTFECAVDVLESCVRERFGLAYRSAYEDENPGSCEFTNIDLGGGSLTLVLSGRGSGGRSFSIPASCQCSGASCACAMRMPYREPLPEATPVPYVEAPPPAADD